MDIEIGQRYKHYKGREYIILNVGHDTETLERVVVYQGQYKDPEFGDMPIWVRPYDMFVGEVNLNGKTVLRFVLKA